ncbi:MAG: ABC transporter permease [Candidatus Cyclobacteriaceae bacterium M3_2C_046]
MIRHYFIFALRSIWRNRLYAAIIIFSLAIGFSFVTLLTGYNLHELNTDNFHPYKNQIYRVFTDDPFGDREQFSNIPFQAADYLEQHYIEVKQVCKIYDLTSQIQLKYGSEQTEELKVIATDAAFFQLFNFPLANGSAPTIKPGQIILTRKTADKITSTEKILNTTLELIDKKNKNLLMVSGIIEPLQENSHLQFDAVVYFEDLLQQHKSGSCYVLLDEKASAHHFEQKINQNSNIAKPFDKKSVKYHLQQLKDAYFNNPEPGKHQVAGNYSLVETNVLVTVFIIFISLYNFISLYSLYTNARCKEFGIRKTLGGNRRHFLAMVFVEILILIAISWALTYVLVSWLHQSFSETFQVSYQMDYYLKNDLILLFFGLMVLVSLIILLVFSQKLASIKPLGLLKNLKPKSSGGIWSIFTLQYTLAIGLIIASLIFIKQINFIKNKPLGFNRHLVQVMPPDKEERNKLAAFKQELLRNTLIERAALGSGNPISDNIIIMDKLPNGELYTSYLFLGDQDYMATVGFELVEGKFTNDRKGVYINQKFARNLDLTNPVGTLFPNTDREILGLIKDFNIYSLKKEIPNVMVQVEEDQPMMMVKYEQEYLGATLNLLEKEWKQLFQSRFRYKIVDQDLLKRHEEDLALFKIILAFMIGSLIIANFGLFAFSWNASHQRTKEIAIRKVVGSNLSQIFYLLNRRLVLNLIIAFIVASPIAYFMMQKWLQEFAFRTAIEWWIFALAGALTMLIAFGTISYQTLKAALTNPVEALKNE